MKILKWAQLGIYFIENDEIRYGWGFMLLKINLLHSNCWSKVRLGIYSIKKVEIRYGWKFILLKKLRLGTTWKAKVRQDWRFALLNTKKLVRLWIYFIENAEILYSWGFIPFKMLKYSKAEDLFHLKCWNKVQLWIYSNEKSQNKAQLGIYSIEKTEIRYGWGKPHPQRIFLL